jgi:hypothetical protein
LPVASSGLALIAISLILLWPSRVGYSQTATPFGLSASCEPFQKSVVLALSAGATNTRGTLQVTPGTKVTIEQIGMRVDTVNALVPALAFFTTSVASVTTAYYVPIPVEYSSKFVTPWRPLALMQSGPFHADSGTDLTFWFAVDPTYYAGGSGRVEWSVSGVSCPA